MDDDDGGMMWFEQVGREQEFLTETRENENGNKKSGEGESDKHGAAAVSNFAGSRSVGLQHGRTGGMLDTVPL